MELLQLKYFKVVAQLEHLSRAAEQIGISQPALSIMISNLEKDLGIMLFDRTNRKIQLNERGRVFLDYVDQALLLLENGEHAIRELQQQESNVINLGCTYPKFAYSILCKIFPLMPQITIRQTILNNRDIASFLRENPSSFVLANADVFEDFIDATEIYEEQMVLAVSEQNPLSQRKSVTLWELRNEPFIAMNEGTDFRNLCDKYCVEAGFQPKNVMECDHVTCTEMVRLNYGISLTSGIFLSGKRAASGICIVPVREPVCYRRISLLKLKNRFYSGVAKEFEKNVVQIAGALTAIASHAAEQSQFNDVQVKELSEEAV